MLARGGRLRGTRVEAKRREAEGVEAESREAEGVEAKGREAEGCESSGQACASTLNRIREPSQPEAGHASSRAATRIRLASPAEVRLRLNR